jgi:F-type H+-transporting ATPase subunit b
MEQFVGQLGIDWRLLLSQAVNFLVVLLVLRLFVYKPVLHLLHERRARIEEGIAKTAEAERRLSESEEVKKEKIREAEQEVLQLFKESDSKLKQTEEERLRETEKKVQQAMKNAELMVQQKQIEFDEVLEKNARSLVRAAVERVAALDPEKIDEALIDRATREALKHQ